MAQALQLPSATLLPACSSGQRSASCQYVLSSSDMTQGVNTAKLGACAVCAECKAFPAAVLAAHIQLLSIATQQLHACCPDIITGSATSGGEGWRYISALYTLPSARCLRSVRAKHRPGPNIAWALPNLVLSIQACLLTCYTSPLRGLDFDLDAADNVAPVAVYPAAPDGTSRDGVNGGSDGADRGAAGCRVGTAGALLAKPESHISSRIYQ